MQLNVMKCEMISSSSLITDANCMSCAATNLIPENHNFFIESPGLKCEYNWSLDKRLLGLFVKKNRVMFLVRKSSIILTADPDIDSRRHLDQRRSRLPSVSPLCNTRTR